MNIYHNFSIIRRWFSQSKAIFNLGPFYKTNLDIWGCFECFKRAGTAFYSTRITAVAYIGDNCTQ